MIRAADQECARQHRRCLLHRAARGLLTLAPTKKRDEAGRPCWESGSEARSVDRSEGGEARSLDQDIPRRGAPHGRHRDCHTAWQIFAAARLCRSSPLSLMIGVRLTMEGVSPTIDEIGDAGRCVSRSGLVGCRVAPAAIFSRSA